jgi:hypothetical protein
MCYELSLTINIYLYSTDQPTVARINGQTSDMLQQQNTLSPQKAYPTALLAQIHVLMRCIEIRNKACHNNVNQPEFRAPECYPSNKTTLRTTWNRVLGTLIQRWLGSWRNSPHRGPTNGLSQINPVLTYLHAVLPSDLFQNFRQKWCIPSHPNARYVHVITLTIGTGWTVQIMDLFITQFSPTSCYFHFLRSKLHPRHSVIHTLFMRKGKPSFICVLNTIVHPHQCNSSHPHLKCMPHAL